MDSVIRRINHYPLDNSFGFASVYPLDSAIHRLNNWSLASVVQKVAKAIHRINYNPEDKDKQNELSYPVDSTHSFSYHNREKAKYRKLIRFLTW